MLHLEVPVAARRDILEIAAFLHAESPSAAARFVDAVEASFTSLLRAPRQGRPRQFGGRKLRGLRSAPVPGFRNYIVFYTVWRTRVRIVRVLHGARDVESELSPGDR